MIAKDKALLITGAEGFVGSHLIQYLQGQGYSNLHGTAYRDITPLQQTLGTDHAWQLDLEDEATVSQLIETIQPAAVIHLAARAAVGESFAQAWPVLQTNIHLQLVMLEALRQHAPQARLLSIGSAQQYGVLPPELQSQSLDEDTRFFPNNPYAVSKITTEYLAQVYQRSYGMDVVHVRPFNQIGPSQTAAFVIAAWAQQIVKIERGEQPKLMVGNLAAIRDFTDVRDAVVAYEIMLQSAPSGEIYNLGSGAGVSLQSVLDRLIELAQVPIEVEVDPARLRPSDVPFFVADNSKIRALGWEPRYSLDQTLQDVLTFERQQKESAA